MVDREDDIRAGAKSTAILFGEADLVALGVLYAGFFWAMWLVGARAELGLYYQGGLAAAAGVVLLQFWIARGRGRAECFLAFRANQWVGLAVFAGIAAHYALANAAGP
jgi:4-hydroxybenzoate polyprenyltransferase